MAKQKNTDQESRGVPHHILKDSKPPARTFLDNIPELKGYKLFSLPIEGKRKGPDGAVRVLPQTDYMTQAGFFMIGVHRDAGMQPFRVSEFSCSVEEARAAAQRALNNATVGETINPISEIAPPPSSEEIHIRGSLLTLRQAIDNANVINGAKGVLEAAYQAINDSFEGYLKTLQESTELKVEALDVNGQLSAVNRELISNAEQLGNQIRQLQQELNDAKKRETTRTAIQSIGQVAEAADRESAEITALRVQIRAATEQLAESNRLRDEATAQARTSSQRITEIEGELRHAAALQQELTALKGSLNAKSVAMTRLETDLEAARKQIESLTNDLQRVSEQPAVDHTNEGHLSIEIDRLSRIVRDNGAQLNAYQETLRENAILRGQVEFLEKTRKENDELTESNKLLEKQVDELTKAVESKKLSTADAIRGLSQQLSKQRSESEELLTVNKTYLAEVQTKHEALRGQLDFMAERESTLKVEKAKTKRELSIASSQDDWHTSRELVDSLDRTETTLKGIRSQRAGAEQSLQDLETEQSRLNSELITYTTRHDRLVIAETSLRQVAEELDSTHMANETWILHEPLGKPEELVSMDEIDESIPVGVFEQEPTGQELETNDSDESTTELASSRGLPIALLYPSKNRKQLRYPTIFTKAQAQVDAGTDLAWLREMIGDAKTRAQALDRVRQGFEGRGMRGAGTNMMLNTLKKGFTELRLFSKGSRPIDEVICELLERHQDVVRLFRSELQTEISSQPHEILTSAGSDGGTTDFLPLEEIDAAPTAELSLEVVTQPEEEDLETWFSALQGLPIGLLYSPATRRMLEFPSQWKGQASLLSKGIDLSTICRLIINCETEDEAVKLVEREQNTLGLNNKTIAAMRKSLHSLGLFKKSAANYKQAVIDGLISAHPKIVEIARMLTGNEPTESTKTNTFSQPLEPAVAPAIIQPEATTKSVSEVVAPITRTEDLDKEIKLWVADLRGRLVQLLYTTASKKDLATNKGRQKSTKELSELKYFELGAVASIVVRANTLDEMEKKLREYLRKVRITRKAARSIIGAIKSGADELKLYDKKFNKDIADRLDAVAAHVGKDNKDNKGVYRLMSDWKEQQQ